MNLYPYQQTACDIMKQRSFCLFFPMGTGKTATAISAAKELDTPRLIVASKGALYNWQDEILTWDKSTKEEDILLLGHKHTGKRKWFLSQERKHKWVITNHHALLNKDFGNYWITNPPEVFIADEAQRFSSVTAKWSRVFRKLANKTRWVGGKVYILTGTPAKNGEHEIYNLIRAVEVEDVPNFDFNYGTFVNYFFADVAPIEAKYKILKMRPTKKSRFMDVVKQNSISVKLREALPFLPPLVKKELLVPMSSEQKRVYKELQQEKKAEYNGEQIKVQQAVALIARFRQIASGVVPISEEMFEKTPKEEEFLENIEKIDGKAIVWANFNPAVDHLLKLLSDKGVAVIRGGQTGEARQAEIDRFRTDDSVRFMVANPQAGGDSINLVEASYILRWDQSLSMERTEQSDARALRKGSEIHDVIFRLDFICEGSVEEDIVKKLTRKQAGNQAIINIAKTLIG